MQNTALVEQRNNGAQPHTLTLGDVRSPRIILHRDGRTTFVAENGNRWESPHEAELFMLPHSERLRLVKSTERRLRRLIALLND